MSVPHNSLAVLLKGNLKRNDTVGREFKEKEELVIRLKKKKVGICEGMRKYLGNWID